jgi:hypothetical protein
MEFFYHKIYLLRILSKKYLQEWSLQPTSVEVYGVPNILPPPNTSIKGARWLLAEANLHKNVRVRIVISFITPSLP